MRLNNKRRKTRGQASATQALHSRLKKQFAATTPSTESNLEFKQLFLKVPHLGACAGLINSALFGQKVPKNAKRTRLSPYTHKHKPVQTKNKQK